jgi:hypothetical protein
MNARGNLPCIDHRTAPQPCASDESNNSDTDARSSPTGPSRCRCDAVLKSYLEASMRVILWIIGIIFLIGLLVVGGFFKMIF